MVSNDTIMKYEEKLIRWKPTDMREIILREPDDFLRVKETLTRIGVSSKRKPNTLYQSCHILHKQGHYFIVHFKELLMLDGKTSNFSENDRNRRNTITQLLSDWGLLEILHPELNVPQVSIQQIKIISFRDKPNWTLIKKYSIGNKT